MKPFRLLGIDLQPHTYSSLVAQIGEWIANDLPLQQICTVNPEFFVIAAKNKAFYRVMQQATCTADGIGIVLAAKILREPKIERVTGTDAIEHIAAAAAENGWRIFLIGCCGGYR